MTATNCRRTANLRPPDGARTGHRRRLSEGEGGNILDKDGWFDTGDVATIDPGGYMQITDRAKDVIKSGGEWISSIEIETSPSVIRKSPKPPSSASRTRNGTNARC